jgi:hypothetical protein
MAHMIAKTWQIQNLQGCQQDWDPGSTAIWVQRWSANRIPYCSGVNFIKAFQLPVWSKFTPWQMHTYHIKGYFFKKGWFHFIIDDLLHFWLSKGVVEVDRTESLALRTLWSEEGKTSTNSFKKRIGGQGR